MSPLHWLTPIRRWWTRWLPSRTGPSNPVSNWIFSVVSQSKSSVETFQQQSGFAFHLRPCKIMVCRTLKKLILDTVKRLTGVKALEFHSHLYTSKHQLYSSLVWLNQDNLLFSFLFLCKYMPIFWIQCVILHITCECTVALKYSWTLKSGHTKQIICKQMILV